MRKLVFAALAASVLASGLAVAAEMPQAPVAAQVVGTFQRPVAGWSGQGQVLKVTDGDMVCYIAILPPLTGLMDGKVVEESRMALSCVPQK